LVREFSVYAYDTFWPYAYDDVYDGMFGRYAYGSGSAYASVSQPRSAPGGGGAAVSAADLCAGQTAGLTDWPIERIAQAVEPNDERRAALDQFKDAAARALESTPTGRLAAMHQRLDAMLQAVRTVRPPLEKFYQLLNDEQKARFNALGPDDTQDQPFRRDPTQVGGERASGIGSLPTGQIERTAARQREPREGLSHRALGVSYVFPAGHRQAHPIGTQDHAALTRLARAGKLTFVDDEARGRYEAMKRVGLFGA
jgi:hypothetical protein